MLPRFMCKAAFSRLMHLTHAPILVFVYCTRKQVRNCLFCGTILSSFKFHSM